MVIEQGLKFLFQLNLRLLQQLYNYLAFLPPKHCSLVKISIYLLATPHLFSRVLSIEWLHPWPYPSIQLCWTTVFLCYWYSQKCVQFFIGVIHVNWFCLIQVYHQFFPPLFGFIGGTLQFPCRLFHAASNRHNSYIILKLSGATALWGKSLAYKKLIFRACYRGTPAMLLILFYSE